MRIEKSFSFDAAHMLSDYEGKCANLHGHTYGVTVIIETDLDLNTHMVMDFNEIKKVFNCVDHAIIFSGVYIRDPAEQKLYEWATLNSKAYYVLPDDCKSTAEDMSQHFAEVIRHMFVSNNCTVTVQLRETATSQATGVAK